MTALVCFTMDNLGDAADLGRGVIREPRRPGERPFLEVGFPAMLDLYARHGLQLTYFVEGWNGKAHPDEIRQILDHGHELGMHGWQHENWAELDDARARELAQRATDALERAAGYRPRAFRAPGGRRAEGSAALLQELGYRIDASLDPSGTDGGPVNAIGRDLWTVPYRWDMVDATHWLWHGRTCAQVEEIWVRELETAAREDSHLVFIWHPHVMGMDANRLAVGESILRFVCGDERFRLTGLQGLIDHYRPARRAAAP